MSSFSAWDYVIVAATLLISLLTGFYFRFSGGRQKTNEEYLLANRDMGILPVSVSLMASYLSAIAIFGVSSEVYSTGIIYSLIIFGISLGVIIAAFLFIPIFYKLNITSTYEYLELRFGKTTRVVTSLIFTVQITLYNAVVLYSPAIVLESVIGLDKNISILMIGIVCTIYSTLGGMKAVIWTDFFQSVLMFVSVLIVLISTFHKSGGWNETFRIASEGGRINYNNWNPSIFERHSVWSIIVGATFLYTGLFGVNHTQVIRCKAMSSLKKAKTALFLSIPMTLLMNIFTALSGIGLYVYYHKCDPLTDGRITSYNQIMSLYIAEAFGTVQGVPGLFAAGVLNASLSTISSACNALAGLTVTDYLGPFFTPSPLWTKSFAFFYGVLFTILAFFAEYFGDNVVSAALTIFGTLGGPVLGVFSLGIFTTFANENGAVIAALTGTALNAWTAYGQPRPSTIPLEMATEECFNNVTAPIMQNDPEGYFFLYRISYLYLSLIGFLWVMVVGSIISLIWKKKQPWENKEGAPIDSDLFSPLLRSIIIKRNKI